MSTVHQGFEREKPAQEKNSIGHKAAVHGGFEREKPAQKYRSLEHQPTVHAGFEFAEEDHPKENGKAAEKKSE